MCVYDISSLRVKASLPTTSTFISAIIRTQYLRGFIEPVVYYTASQSNTESLWLNHTVLRRLDTKY